MSYYSQRRLTILFRNLQAKTDADNAGRLLEATPRSAGAATGAGKAKAFRSSTSAEDKVQPPSSSSTIDTGEDKIVAHSSNSEPKRKGRRVSRKAPSPSSDTLGSKTQPPLPSASDSVTSPAAGVKDGKEECTILSEKVLTPPPRAHGGRSIPDAVLY